MYGGEEANEFSFLPPSLSLMVAANGRGLDLPRVEIVFQYTCIHHAYIYVYTLRAGFPLF